MKGLPRDPDHEMLDNRRCLIGPSQALLERPWVSQFRGYETTAFQPATDENKHQAFCFVVQPRIADVRRSSTAYCPLQRHLTL